MLLICFPRCEKFPGLFPLLSVYPPSSQRRGLLWFGSPLHHDNKIASRNMFWYVQHAFTCTSSTNSSEHIAGEVQAMKAAAILVWAQGTNGLWLKNLPPWSIVHWYVGPDLLRVHPIPTEFAIEYMCPTLLNLPIIPQCTRPAFIKRGLEFWAPLKSVAKVSFNGVRISFVVLIQLLSLNTTVSRLFLQKVNVKCVYFFKWRDFLQK